MTKLRSRLLRQLTYANVMASIAVFVALGGIGYAATSINGNKIVKQTIGAGKLKNGTLTSTQVKANGLSGSVIDEASLGTVPSAQTAASATTAGSASTATTAEHATEAATAADSDSLDGFTAEELQIACPPDTELFGGMCWDEDPRPIKLWVVASIECGDAGGRLPTLGELLAYVAQPGEQVTGQSWSADVVDLNAGVEQVLTTAELSKASTPASAQLGFRCLFYRSN